jgi:putative transposase
VDNLVALPSDKPGFRPVLVNGRSLKSINHDYNKRRAEYHRHPGHPGCIDLYLHTTSRWMIDLLVAERIGNAHHRQNDRWKQVSPMSATTNQNVVNLPRARFISMLPCRVELVGIRVILTEEFYTSKASFLRRDPLPVCTKGEKSEHQSGGKLVKRRFCQAQDGRFINADLNSSIP